MAGFVIEAIVPGADFAGALKLVDLGQCEEMRGRAFGTARAGWTRWTGSRQLAIYQTGNSLLLIEGEPDRLPRPGEALHRWLDGRGGSFRGFQIVRGDPGRPVSICAFVDPLATRPIYLLSSPQRICLADKLSTVIANTPGLECAWDRLLEYAVLGSLYSEGTSMRGVERLRAGEIVEIEGAAIVQRRCAPYPSGGAAKPDPTAPARLEQAMRAAIGETWIEPEGRLLLSGGLDSRLILGLATGLRKTITNDWYPQETAIARQVAAACDADFLLAPFDPNECRERMVNGYLVTGAMLQSRYVTHLGAACRWRRAGIPAITHGYFHNSVFRGWLAERWQRYPDRDSPLYAYLGEKAHYFDMFGNVSPQTMAQVLSFLSAEGRDRLSRQLRRLADSIEPVMVDGFDLTFERRVLADISRQVFFAVFLGWIEEIDVESPVFHPAVWAWYASTHPADRHRDHAVHILYRTIGRSLAEIPDANTGKPVAAVPEGPRELWRNQAWFPAARTVVGAVRRLRPARPPAPTIAGVDWDAAYRQQPILDTLCAAIEELRENPLFEAHSLGSALASYLNGDDRLRDALWVMASVRQLDRFVGIAGAGDAAVRNVPAESFARSS